MIDYGSTIQKDSAERSAKGGCGGKVLSATGNVRGQRRPGRRGIRDEGEKLANLGRYQKCNYQLCRALIDKLYGGQSVNIKDFGVFSLSARTVGVEKKEDCTAKNIKAVKINFRPSTTIRPDVTATRAGQKIDFYDLEALVNKDGSSSGGNSSGDQGGSGSGEGGLDENPLG